MKTERILTILLILILIPLFFSGPILCHYNHYLLGFIFGLPAALFAWPTMFALVAALDEEDNEKRYKNYEDEKR